MPISNKNVCLIKIADEITEKIPPFGLLYVGNSLKQAGFDVEVIQDDFDNILNSLDTIKDKKPLFIGFSVITGLSTYYSAQISRKFKDRGLTVVWGGVHPSLLSRECLRENYVDFTIIGEGEKTIVELARELSGETNDFSRIKGLGYKDKENKIILNQPRDLNKDLTDVRMDFSLVDMSKYVQESESWIDGKKVRIRKMSYISSRGCPHSCGFCYNLKFNQRKWRPFPEQRVFDDIAYLKEKYNVNAIHFWDDNLFGNPKWALKILRRIKVYPEFELRIDYITDEMAREFKEMNTINMLIGCETGSNRILELINKGFTKEFMREKIEILAKYNLNVLYSFILALPTETQQELYQTIDLINYIAEIHKNSSFTVGMYMPYPGTDLYQAAIKNGFKPPPKNEDWQYIDRWRNTVPLPWIDQEVCRKIRYFSVMLKDKNHLFREWAFFRLKNKILRFNLDIKLVLLLKKIGL